jgi:hypothetical protein
MVLPSLSPLSDSPAGAGSVEVPPPLRFKPLKGQVTQVRIGAEKVVHGQPDLGSMGVSKIAGLVYEEHFLSHLRKEYPQVYIHPQIHFRDEGDYRTIVPDALLIGFANSVNVMQIVEVKSQHMPEAWWQLEKLYKPVLQAGFQNFSVRCLEVVKILDPQMPWPGEFTICQSLSEAVKEPPEMGVLRWRRKT